MMDKWFVHASGLSASAVRFATGEEDQEAFPRRIRNLGHRIEEDLPVFEIPFMVAALLDRMRRDGSDPLFFRFFRQKETCEIPFEEKFKSKESKKVTDLRRKMKTAINKQKGR